MKFDYFSKETVEILRNAHKKATLLHFKDVGTDHLLLAMTDFEELFTEFGYNAKMIQTEVSMLLGQGDCEEEAYNYTPRAKHVIEQSLSEMEKYKEVSVSPHHLLISLLHQKGGVAIRALENLLIDKDAFREKIENKLNQNAVSYNN